VTLYTMNWSVKVTDLAIVFATLVGPFLAVYVTERQRKRADARNRRIHIFRTLMATRNATLAGTHIEALNLVELEFAGNSAQVVDAWKMYKSHLADQHYPTDQWETRRRELMVELLFVMSRSLGYAFEKAQINTAAYYPGLYQQADIEMLDTRRLWLEVLQGKRALPISALPEPPRTDNEPPSKDPVSPS
jgi:hypothetical protein